MPATPAAKPTAALALLCGLAIALHAQPGAQPAAQPPAQPATQPADTPTTLPAPVTPPVAGAPRVQLAILLDTSGSMDGLIEQAKTQIWSIVNQLALGTRQGRKPNLEVALYEYGNDGIPHEEGHVRMILPLTTDLDKVSEELFKLKTNGGSEYCGQAVQAAARGLQWSPVAEDLRIIVIAGNEPFTQGAVNYAASVPEAVKKGIIVNTIFCGDKSEGIESKWEDGAKLGEGTFACIDHSSVQPHIPAPQDDEIIRLSAEINTTYLAWGARGTEGAARQQAQDANAASAAPAAAIERAATKAGGLYSNSWDLCEAVSEGRVKIEDVKDEDLPEAMRAMSVAERKAHIESQAKKRADIQKQIADLSAKRDAFVAEKRREMSGGDQTLGAALRAAIRAQAESRGFVFSKGS